tara:strand:+ start:216 stop:818 length:603 start_codon:yes stop_codon:yes gene_type:complete
MKINQKTAQIGLTIFGILLILGTYLFYPKIIKEKKTTELKLSEKESEESTIIIEGQEANIFENVEYQGVYNLENSFTIKSDKAHILKDEPDIVYMKNMLATIYMNDGKVWTIRGDIGSYNKINYDCYFEQNVRATDNETTILADNIDLLSTEDYAMVYNNVSLNNDSGSLKADKINYDFETQLYKISMFDDKSVKIKIIK